MGPFSGGATIEEVRRALARAQARESRLEALLIEHVDSLRESRAKCAELRERVSGLEVALSSRPRPVFETTDLDDFYF